MAVMAFCKGQTVDEALAYFMSGQTRRKLRPIADMRKNNGLRKEGAKGFQRLFAAPVGCKPVMNKSYAQMDTSVKTRK